MFAPTVVAVPPIFDAMLTDKQSIALMLLLLGVLTSIRFSGSIGTEITLSRTARRMGIIIAQVAVSEIHIERKAVESMKPRSKHLGDVPTIRKTYNEIRLCRLQSSMAMASIKPESFRFHLIIHGQD